jgi:hypothetical protein
MATFRRVAEYARHSPRFSALRQGRFFKNTNLGEGIRAGIWLQYQNDIITAWN